MVTFQRPVVPCSLLRSQRELVVAGEGEGERFASVGSYYFAPDLRGGSASACSERPICPVETVHPHVSIILPQLRTSAKPRPFPTGLELQVGQWMSF